MKNKYIVILKDKQKGTLTNERLVARLLAFLFACL